MARTGSFQVSKFDPILLISQIVAQQSFMYLTLTSLLVLGLNLLDINLSLSAIFDFRVSILMTKSCCGTNYCLFQQINVTDSEGILIISCFITNSLFGALFLWYFVKRRKMCLDFW